MYFVGNQASVALDFLHTSLSLNCSIVAHMMHFDAQLPFKVIEGHNSLWYEFFYIGVLSNVVDKV